MEKSEIETLRQQVEDLYLERISDLDRQRSALDEWRNHRLSALALLSEDEWLTLPGLDAHQSPSSPPTPSSRRRSSPSSDVSQTEEIRAAIASLQKNISNRTVREWLDNNRPEISDMVNVRSIRTYLWRMEKAGNLIQVGMEGTTKIYDLPNDQPTPSGVEIADVDTDAF